MSKVNILHTVAKDTFAVQAATITTTWLPGQFCNLTSTGEWVQISNAGGSFIGVFVDDDDECSAPPTGSIVTVAYGSGTRLQISHAEEVAASSAARVYMSDVPGTALNSVLYCSKTGKWTAAGDGSGVTGSVAGILVGVPTVNNSYTLEVILK